MTSEMYRHVSHCCHLPLNLFRNGSCGLSTPQKTCSPFVTLSGLKLLQLSGFGWVHENNILRPTMLVQIVTCSKVMGCTSVLVSEPEDDQQWRVFDEELQA